MPVQILNGSDSDNTSGSVVPGVLLLPGTVARESLTEVVRS